MKKLFLTLAILLGLTGLAKAETVTFDFTSNDYGLPNDGNTYVTCPSTISQDGVTITLNSSVSQAVRRWTDGLRLYKNKDITGTIAVASGSITNIDMTA